MDANFFQTFANLLAETVATQLVERRVSHLRSTLAVTPSRHLDRHIAGTPWVYQATSLEAWPDSAEKMPARDFLYRYLRRWATNVAIKLSGPGILTTYPMALPNGVEAAALGTHDDLVLRCLLDFNLHDGMQVLRIDALASWDE